MHGNSEEIREQEKHSIPEAEMLFLLVKMKITQLCPLCDPHGLPWDSPGEIL